MIHISHPDKAIDEFPEFKKICFYHLKHIFVAITGPIHRHTPEEEQ